MTVEGRDKVVGREYTSGKGIREYRFHEELRDFGVDVVHVHVQHLILFWGLWLRAPAVNLSDVNPCARVYD